MRIWNRIMNAIRNVLYGRKTKMKSLLTAITILTMVAGSANATSVGYTVQSNGDDNLYSIDLSTGNWTRIGPVGYGDVEGLAFDRDGTLYGVEGTMGHVITIDIQTGQGTLVGTCNLANIDTGAAISPDTGKLYVINGESNTSNLYEIDKTTGASTLVAAYDVFADGLAIGPGDIAYASDLINAKTLYRIDLTAPSAITTVGALGIVTTDQSGLARCPLTDQYYLLREDGLLYTVDTKTGNASLIGNTIDNSEGLAIIPEPATVLLLGLGGLVLIRGWRR